MPDSLTVAITGATGLVGSALVAALLKDGHRVRRLVRHSTTPIAGVDDVPWNPAARELDLRDLAGIDAAVNLAGENLAQRWSGDVKRRIRASRIEATSLLADRMAQLEPRPLVLASASAVGIYGDRGDEILDESSPIGTDFLSAVAREWEAATAPAARAGVRVVTMRFGVVLSAHGGALAKMLPPFKLGAGGTLGDGHQWMSWIALDDLVGAIGYAIGNDALAGAVNVTAPNPVTNAQLTETLGHVLHRPTITHVPKVALRLLYGEMADAALLASQRAVPRTLIERGFHFAYPDLPSALSHALA